MSHVSKKRVTGILCRLRFDKISSYIKSLACHDVVMSGVSHLWCQGGLIFLAMWLAKTQVYGSGSGNVARVRKAQRQLRWSASNLKAGQWFAFKNLENTSDRLILGHWIPLVSWVVLNGYLYLITQRIHRITIGINIDAAYRCKGRRHN